MADGARLSGPAPARRPTPPAAPRETRRARPAWATWALVRLRLTPWWLRVAVVWALSRVVTTAILLAAAHAQVANPWTGPGPSYGSFASIWDGHWYYIIAVSGYPTELPVADWGGVGENAWAFLPVYPFLARAVMALTGLSFEAVGPGIALVFGLGCALVLHRLLSRVLGEGRALGAVVLFCFAPLSAILQVAYAESLALFLLLLALLFVVERRYVLLVPVLPVMALTRPSGLAFALFLALHFAQRWWVRRRDPFPLVERLEVAGVAIWSGIAGLAWPAIAWAVTGSPTAYTDTELAWRVPYIGVQHLLPFAPWIQGAEWWLRWFVARELALPLGLVLLAVVVGGYVAFLLTPWARRLGPELRLWLVAYPVYLLAVFFPQSSTFRLLVPLAPGLGALAVPRSRAWIVLLAALGVGGQILWVHWCWQVLPPDWSPP
ncbi:MAG: hypothetical protein J0G30_07470 [Actinomycetales bacterium]|nr:hypothetical protein [Actinomycetales bacterium]